MRNTIKFLIKLHKVKQLFFEKSQKKIYSKIKTGQKKIFYFLYFFQFWFYPHNIIFIKIISLYFKYV